jgi:hypothetical protein
MNTYPIPAFVEPESTEIKSLQDFITAIESRIPLVTSIKAGDLVQNLARIRRTLLRVADYFGRPLERVLLSEIVDIDEDLIAFIDGLGLSHQNSVQHACDKNKLLRFARELGWSCESFRLRESWFPVQEALRGDSWGAGGIVKYALKNEKATWDFSDNDMLGWRQEMIAQGRAILTVEQEASVFRTRMRQATLQSQFPCLDLQNKNPAEYSIRSHEMPQTLWNDIEDIVRWKREVQVKGRDSKLAVGRRTGEKILIGLMEMSGFAINLMKLSIRRVRNLIVPKIVCGFIDWLLYERSCGIAGIIAKLASICALTRVHPLFAGRDYSWFRQKLNRLPREPRARLQKRKDMKCIRYEALAEVPVRIRAFRVRSRGLSPVQEARLVHDQLVMSFPLHLPWRQINLRECGIQSPAAVNLFEAAIPADIWNEVDPPLWAKTARKSNPHRKFWQFVFYEQQAKGRRVIRGLIPPKLVPLLRIYLQRYRHLLIKERDPGTLFLNRAGRAMTQDDMPTLMVGLTSKYIGHRLTPHVMRDIYSEQFLAKGGSVKQLQRMLWHRDISTTWRYCQRFNTSHGAVALDRHFSHLIRGH